MNKRLVRGHGDVAPTTPPPDHVQRVQVLYRHHNSTRSYAYEWAGHDHLEEGDIVVVPGTSIDPGHYQLGVVTDEECRYRGEMARILYAIRGEFLR